MARCWQPPAGRLRAIRPTLVGYVYFIKIFVTTIWRHNHFKSPFCSFVHAISWVKKLHAWRHFSLLVERVFCLVAWLSFWPHLTYFHQEGLPHTEIDFFTLIQRDKVQWVCVTLIKGFFRAANRNSNILNRFSIIF